jgi:hypothetical protein
MALQNNQPALPKVRATKNAERMRKKSECGKSLLRFFKLEITIQDAH